MEVIGEDIDAVTYDEKTMMLLESCKRCPFEMPFSWKVCLQCQRPRVELFRTSASTMIKEEK